MNELCLCTCQVDRRRYQVHPFYLNLDDYLFCFNVIVE